jgi:hypothetical protein
MRFRITIVEQPCLELFHDLVFRTGWDTVAVASTERGEFKRDLSTPALPNAQGRIDGRARPQAAQPTASNIDLKGEGIELGFP